MPQNDRWLKLLLLANAALGILVVIALVASLDVRSSLQRVLAGRANTDPAYVAAPELSRVSESTMAGVAAPFDSRAEDARLRQLIREEIDAALDRDRAARRPSVGEARAEVDPAAIREVEDKLQFILSSGEISAAELDRLQLSIAQLDEASRKEKFSELARAINLGTVKVIMR